MKLWFTPQQIDRVIRRAPWYLFGGLALVLLHEPLHSFLFLTGFFALWLGACGGTFPSWRSEPGLWMLSALFLVISAGLYGIFTYHHVADFLRGRHDRLLLAFDATLATSLLWVQTRFLLSVRRANRLFSKSMRDIRDMRPNELG